MEIGDIEEDTERGIWFKRKIWRVCYGKEFVRGHEDRNIALVISFTDQRKAVMFSSILKSLEEIKKLLNKKRK